MTYLPGRLLFWSLLALAGGMFAQSEEICYNLVSRENTVLMGEATSTTHVRNIVSREATVLMGEATSTTHVRNIVSREATVLMGEATSTTHVRNIVSREYTAGVGEEVFRILPLEDNLWGNVTLSLYAEFVQNPVQMHCSWKLSHDGVVLEAQEDVDWENFRYQWDTTAVKDGVYDFEMRFQRPGQDDVVLSRDFHVQNGISLTMVPGWNLVSVPFGIEETDNGEELFKLSPWILGFANKAYSCAVNSMDAGCAAWVFSTENQSVRIWAKEGEELAVGLPSTLSPGWNLTGICGTEEQNIDCEQAGIRQIYGWDDGKIVPIPMEDGKVLLLPGVGYWLQIGE